MKKHDFIPDWLEREPDQQTFRSIFKWGAKDRFKNPGQGFFSIIKEELGLSNTDFQTPVNLGNKRVENTRKTRISKEDITSGRKFDDACAISTWGMDLHYAHPLYKVHTPDNPFISRAHIGGRVDDSKGDLATNPTVLVLSKDGHGFDRNKGYAIPYRCLYSRNIDNLFAPGRNMSVTRDALGTVRVMQTLGMCGVAVGRAAYVCKKYDTTPRGAYQNHLVELKKVWLLPANHRE